MITTNRSPSLAVRLQVLAAVDYAKGNTIRARIRAVSKQTFIDPKNGQSYQFTWRTIETWRCRYRKHGVTCLDNATRSDKNQQRKVLIPELAEAIKEVLPTLSKNKVGHIPKSTIYRVSAK